MSLNQILNEPSVRDVLSNSQLIQLLQFAFSGVTVILALISVIIAFFAMKISARTAELDRLPLLIIEVSHLGGLGTKFILRNIGKGPAFKVKVDSWKVIVMDIQRIWELKIKLPKPSLIEPSASRELELEGFENGKRARGLENMLATALKEHPNIRLRIQYKSVSGQSYLTEIETGQGGVEVIRASQVTNFLDQFFVFIRFELLDFLSLVKARSVWLFRKPYIKSK